MSIRLHIKVSDNRSPYDGNWVYWSYKTRMAPEYQSQTGQAPQKAARALYLLWVVLPT
jgi:hypothetical protein